MGQQRLRLGEFLIKHGLITEQQLDEALNKQFQTGERLGRILVGMGVVSENKILSALRVHLGCPMINLKKKKDIPQQVLNLVPYDLAKRSQAIPLSVVSHKDGHELLVAMSNPMDTDLIDDIEFVSGCTVKPVLALDTDISHALTRFYESNRSGDEISLDSKDDDDMVIIMGGSEKVISGRTPPKSQTEAGAPDVEKTPAERLNMLLQRDDAFPDFIKHLLDRQLISINDILRIIQYIKNSE
ncbi:MAG: hypothetical protein JW885_03730 [Deltaproteobacteria bacterium]|nr:hypothetical protein [Candidatus Zymogenaceae bacterium]